ncbi:uncharacterized protein [Spinacia oleracea]|uniref:Uncharacterized protein isoform X2 n=1 Tax=Spinacia oleracea TaxID=3562 RepID=A0ABM3R1B9_SPIOL|nr:uncharacterized protein LOC110791698 isoform X2 [Spinacia oleracea]
MASKLAKEEEGSSKTKKRLDDWKEFLLPIHEASTSKHEPTTQDGNTLRTPPDNSIFQKGLCSLNLGSGNINGYQ